MLWVAVLYALAHFYFFLIGRAGDGRPGTLLSFAFAPDPAAAVLVGLLRTEAAPVGRRGPGGRVCGSVATGPARCAELLGADAR